MSRELHGIEKGLRLFQENSDLFIDILSGSAAPNGLGDQLEAPIGSLYIREGSPTGIYQKETNNGNAADWVLNGSGTNSVAPIFRDIVTRAATTAVVAAGSVDPTAWADNESGLDGNDFAVGEYIISGVGGTPQLYEVTAVTSATDITVAAASPALSDNDGFIVRSYLPDSPASQENQALVVFQEGNIIKLADVDWNFATGINLSATYDGTQNGTVAPGDSVEAAIEKLDGNQRDLTTLSGVPQGSTDLGSFSGDIIPDGSNNKEALQALETEIESLNFVAGPADIAQATPTVVDTVLVDECQSVEWEVTAHDKGDPTKVKILTITAFHNGHAGADASNVKDQVYAKARIGNFNLQVEAVLNGTGAAQTMGLQINTNDSDGIRYTVSRRSCVPAL